MLQELVFILGPLIAMLSYVAKNSYPYISKLNEFEFVSEVLVIESELQDMMEYLKKSGANEETLDMVRVLTSSFHTDVSEDSMKYY